MTELFSEGNWFLYPDTHWEDPDTETVYILHTCPKSDKGEHATYITKTNGLCPWCLETMPESIKSLYTLYNFSPNQNTEFTRVIL